MTLFARLHDQRRGILARDAKTEKRLAALYRGTLAPIQHELDALTAKMQRWLSEHPGEDIPRSWLLEDARLHNLQLLIQRQVDTYSLHAEPLVSGDVAAAVRAGTGDAGALLETSVPRGVSWTFGQPSTAALDALGDMPLRSLFANWGHKASQAATQTLFADVALGKNPRVIARDLQDRVGALSYSKALVIARTSAIRAYSAGALATYRANSDVCDGWIWTADLSVNTCAACLALNGSEHSLDEDLDDHPYGRCCKVPKTKSWADILGPLGIDTSDIPETPSTIPDGSEWFDRQSAADQRSILGPGKYAALQNGDISLTDLVGYDTDDVWGRSVYELPLRALVRKGA